MGTQLAPAMRRPRTLVAALVFLGMAVAVVSSLGAPLIPRIAAADHVSLSDAQWSLTITLLVGAVATPTMGRLGDGPRRRAVILGAAAVMPAGDGYLIAALIGCAIWAAAMMVAIVLPRRQGVVTDTRTRDEEPMVEESSRDAATAGDGALAPRPVPGDRRTR